MDGKGNRARCGKVRSHQSRTWGAGLSVDHGLAAAKQRMWIQFLLRVAKMATETNQGRPVTGKMKSHLAAFARDTRVTNSR